MKFLYFISLVKYHFSPISRNSLKNEIKNDKWYDKINSSERKRLQGKLEKQTNEGKKRMKTLCNSF